MHTCVCLRARRSDRFSRERNERGKEGEGGSERGGAWWGYLLVATTRSMLGFVSQCLAYCFVGQIAGKDIFKNVSEAVFV
jgi:hypothetical protein